MLSGGPVETFLAEVGRHLRRDETTCRRVVTEVGDHLRDLVAEGRAQGLDEHAAELEAVHRFGSPRALARGLRRPRRNARAAWAAIALVGAGLCGALGFAELRSGTPGHGTALAGRTTPVGCVVALSVGGGPGANRVRVPVAPPVAIDPRSGTVLMCHGLPGMRLATTVVYHVTAGAPLPVDALTHDVSMATALHQ
jgi:hypothetical protein